MARPWRELEDKLSPEQRERVAGQVARTLNSLTMNPPSKLDLKKDKGLTVQWADGSTSYYSIAYLRKMSPSAEARELRNQLRSNPLTVLPASAISKGPLIATDAELVGNYAIKIRFSDGHDTGIYSWEYLREIDPANKPPSTPSQ